jgi:tRNA (cmo5U34)-methyltransferase
MKSETNVGDEIEQTEGGWEFDDSVAEQFDQHVSQSIPSYRKVQDHVTKIADWFLADGERETVYDLGCATGTTIKRLIETRDRSDPIRYVGIDEARPMLKQAEEKVGVYDTVRLVEEDLTVDPQFPNASLILSLFTLSFLSEGDRRRLLEAAYRDLDSGGALVFVEKTYPEHARFQAMFREHYFDYKQQYFDAEEVVDKAKSLRGQLRPLSRSEYRDLLADAGFEDVEPFYQKYMWWGVIARKR